jgi:hypothetical protein
MEGASDKMSQEDWMNPTKDVIVIEHREKGDMTPGTYRINQDAIDICNNLRLAPKDVIVWQAKTMKELLNKEDMAKIVNDSVRQVVQVEGVMLHDKQKGFFREIFASLTQCISDKGLMRK